MSPRYRRLPGRLRGFIRGSSVWLGDDHLLLVKSTRFREEYKRFYLREVQAIAVARAPRYHISSRAAAIGAGWLLAALGLPELTMYRWALSVVLAAAWLYFSAACSCRCRIYTAVSADELPSVYRTWTARRFLAAVEPRIAQVQGVAEGPWAEAAETRTIGPALAAGTAPAPPNTESTIAPRSHTLTSDVLIAALFAGSLFEILSLKAPPSLVRPWAITFVVLKGGLAVGVFVQHYKGKLQRGMQGVAMATLLAIGVMYYVEQVAASIGQRDPVAQMLSVMISTSRFASAVDAGASFLLGCAGLGVILLGKDSGPA
ncbi:MAG TPA: hypothetical protein VGS58_03690 [Candidatus Sulfopaludibacter sp.]|nr:hypothetical protein [Candidatus Sulfopaludibacter sp.]